MEPLHIDRVFVQAHIAAVADSLSPPRCCHGCRRDSLTKSGGGAQRHIQQASAAEVIQTGQTDQRNRLHMHSVALPRDGR